MTRNDRGESNASIPAWLGWKRNIFYAALAAIVSAVFIFQITRPDSLLGGILGWELKRIDDASREGAAANPGAVTWTSLFAQLERKMPSLPDARPRAGTAQLIYAVDAIHRDKMDAQDAVTRFAPAEDAATFNLLARLAYGWICDQSNAAQSQLSATPDALSRYESLTRIVDAQPPATHATLYNNTMHDAWRNVLQTVIRREDVIASCVRNLRHYDIREHYAALPTIHATLTSLARELHTAGHAPQAETIRQWLDRAYMGLIDNERDYATRLIAAELLTDVRTADFYTAAPGHHRPSKLRDAFHQKVANYPVEMVDMNKSPILFTSDLKRYEQLSACIGFAAITIGLAISLLFRLLAGLLRLRAMTCSPPDLEQSFLNTALVWAAPIGLVLSLGYYCGSTPFLAGRSGSTEGYIIQLAIGATTAAILVIAIAVRLTYCRTTFSVGLCLLWAGILLLVLMLDPSYSIWPTLRRLDFGLGTVVSVGMVLTLMVIASTVIAATPMRVVYAVAIRGWLIAASFTLATSLFQLGNDRSLLLSAANLRNDQVNARIGNTWKSLLPPAADYATSVSTTISTRPAP